MILDLDIVGILPENVDESGSGFTGLFVFAVEQVLGGNSIDAPTQSDDPF